MANPSTLYRFRITLSDVDRSVYDSLDVRVAMHSSETEAFLLTRVLAYALNFEDGLRFSPGLGEPDQPALWLPDSNGGIAKWIDIGNPGARRLHKAAKAARTVRVYTYKDPEVLKREVSGEQIHHAAEIEIFAFDASFLKSLGAILARDNTWAVLHNDGQLVVTAGEESFMGEVQAHRLA
ncbi:YaeQ family protein [Bdellovibrionota bacterium FG-1]